MMLKLYIVALAGLGSLAGAQTNNFLPNRATGPDGIIYDTVKAGPEMELQHLYFDEFPTGIAVSKSGRKFSNYPPGLDPGNTNNGQNGKYTIAELTGFRTEKPYPSVEINNPPGGAINYTTNPPTGANYPNYFIGAQSIIVDSQDKAWVLDTGRALTPDGTLVAATQGGPKLVGIDLTTNKIFKTILFPPTVAYGDSYLNDVRIDYQNGGYAYITDSSVEGRNGLIIADLNSGKSWRHLDGSAKVHPQDQNVEYLWGVPLYVFQPQRPFTYNAFGSDGIALSADAQTLYWKVVGGRYLYAIPTARLRDNSAPNSELLAQHSVTTLGQTGISDGMETDSNGIVYHGNMEQNALGAYNPATGQDTILVRDARINWIDTMSTGTDGYLYFTVNQLVFGPGLAPGTDRRQKPYSLWRVKLPDGGTKANQTGMETEKGMEGQGWGKGSVGSSGH